MFAFFVLFFPCASLSTPCFAGDRAGDCLGLDNFRFNTGIIALTPFRRVTGDPFFLIFRLDILSERGLGPSGRGGLVCCVCDNAVTCRRGTFGGVRHGILTILSFENNSSLLMSLSVLSSKLDALSFASAARGVCAPGATHVPCRFRHVDFDCEAVVSFVDDCLGDVLCDDSSLSDGYPGALSICGARFFVNCLGTTTDGTRFNVWFNKDLPSELELVSVVDGDADVANSFARGIRGRSL